MSGKSYDGLDSLPGVDTEDNKAMYDSQDGLVGSMGLADNSINAEEGVCAKCNKPRPPLEISEVDNGLWVGCDTCESWYHTVCVQDKLTKLGL